MKFERLRKSHKKEIIIGAIAICIIGGALTLVTTRAKYKLTESIDLVKGTINYKPYDFKIMAMYKSDDGTNYTEINEMPSEGYIINEDKTYCTTDNKTKVKGKIKTENGKHYISGLTKSDKCYLYFDKKTTETVATLLGNIEVNLTTPDFSQVATTDEGMFKTSDGMYGGYSYYWRGAVTNNYVKFADKCWRIIRINGDGTLRLIYDGTTCHVNGTITAESIAVTNQTYNKLNGRSEYVGWTYTEEYQRPSDPNAGTTSNAKLQTDTWYTNNLISYADKISDGKFCNDRNTAGSFTWSSQSNSFHYAGYDRNSISPTLSCSNVNDVYTLKIGAITMDEAVMAGAIGSKENDDYYLFNGQNYWTMTPYRFYPHETSPAMVFNVTYLGTLCGVHVGKTEDGIRPVINLRSDVTFESGGTGTQSNPYIVQ